MAVSGISNTQITGTLSNGNFALTNAQQKSESSKFESLLKQMSGVSSSNVSTSHRLNGDYTKGFEGSYTSESDKTASPRGFASNSSSVNSNKKITIDRTSQLYEQSMEMENYLVKMMLSSMRNTITHTSLSNDENSFARKMYEDMMYDNVSESITKNAGFGIADQIYIELSGQR